MFIKSLTISGNNKVIREIIFHNGINLIVDETPISNDKETGNNVGKTTVLMLIDFCLGANGKDIYLDPENRKEEYKLVKNFLVDNQVLIRLILKSDLSNNSSPEICIERNFLPRKKKIQRIDGSDKTDNEFEETLTNFLFPGHYGKMPTFRQIISHNLRYKDQNINYTLKTLNKYTTDAEYETLYLFLFGCDFDQGHIKQDLLAKIKQELTYKNRLEREQTKSTYETALSILEREIIELNRHKFNFNMNKNFELDMDRLNQIRYQINVLITEIGKLNIRHQLIIDAKNDLNLKKSEIDILQLKIIYEQATKNIGDIQKSFEDLYHFHNRMIEEKVNFIVKDLPKLENEIKSKSLELHRLRQEEEHLSLEISCSDSFEELEDLISELNDKYRKKGEYESIIQQLDEVETNIKNYNCQLNDIDDILFSQSFELTIKEQLDKFNKYFTYVSQTLYDEQFAISFKQIINKNGQRIYKFYPINLNFSSGKKQGEISCFDIAYTLFADDENIPCLHFLLNDKKELMHDNQLLKIAQLVNGQGIQFVASILKDKLPNELNKEEFFVVKLSQNDKLFRIEKNFI